MKDLDSKGRIGLSFELDDATGWAADDVGVHPRAYSLCRGREDIQVNVLSSIVLSVLSYILVVLLSITANS